MNTTVRSAVAGDAEAIAALGRKSFSWAFGALFRDDVLARYLDGTYSAGKIAGSLTKVANLYFVAEAEGCLQGFLKLKTGGTEAWQVQKLYVDPDLIQSGIGQRLMQAGEAAMRTRNAPSAWLVVYKGNARAIRFYRGLGYAETGVESHDFEDIRIEFRRMSKALVPPTGPLS
ncbi:GNAT family N-acetyltransferase [Geothrix alkalitolerans]|uniref:GNAT family N-acetyltransferase n=1 Tax=Geothrix alkalitolerans TaxID=2922724 RepID=UPI001FAE9276|nr:GNAT family N-acetyltransferase [Geothrix alkalitolerans]